MSKIYIEQEEKIDVTKNNSSDFFRPSETIRKMMEDIKQETFNGWFPNEPFGSIMIGGINPPKTSKWNLTSDGNGNVVAEFEVPGFSKENLKLEMTEQGLLTVTATNSRKTITDSVSLGANPNKAVYKVLKASCEHGLLTVVVKVESKNAGVITIPVE